MSIINAGLQKGYQRQKKSLMEQIENAGIKLLNFNEIDSEQSKASSAVTSTLKSIVGGKLQPDYWQIFTLEQGGRKQVYVQPYSGSTILPGEHHLYINGSIDYPIVLEDTAIFGGPVWSSSNSEFAKKLNKTEKNLKKAVKKIEFEWKIGTGRIELDWAIQVFSMGNGTSKIVMKTGRYGGITSYEVGFNELNKVVDALSSIVKDLPGQKQIPPKNSSYDEIADNILGVTSKSIDTDSKPRKSSFKNYQAIITNAVRPHVGKQIFLGDIPDKKEKNLRKFVMPKEFSNHNIIAAFDTTVFGSAKAGVVFTSTHCFAREDDIHVSFELKDIVSIKSMETNKDDQAELILTSGNVLVPVSIHEEVLEVFRAIANG